MSSFQPRQFITTRRWIQCFVMFVTTMIYLHLFGYAQIPLLAFASQQNNQTSTPIPLEPWPVWSPDLSVYTFTYSIAWGDVDGDGDLDLAVSTHQGSSVPTRVYLNVDNILQTTPAWLSGYQDENTTSLAWGDVNGDGALDLAVGNDGQSNRIYLNVGGMLQTTPVWSSAFSERTTSIAWGDVDGDGDFDLAVGNSNRNGEGEPDQPNRIYLNVDGMLQTTPVWSSMLSENTTSVVWGDVDDDGDLDLAVGNDNSWSLDPSQSNRVYLNVNGMLQTTSVWSSTLSENTTSVAWGDVDSDGDLDLATGNNGQPNRVYLNVKGMLQTMPVWSSALSEQTTSVAWGDADGDGDLDLAAGNQNEPSRVYLNTGDMLQTTPAWSSALSEYTTSIAWGDVDSDGDLDLAIGNTVGLEGYISRIYLNVSGMLQTTLTWSSTPSEYTRSIAWGDMDSDGDLDLAVGNESQPSKVYLNVGGMLQSLPAWSSALTELTTSLAWGDADGDGDLDLAVGNFGRTGISSHYQSMIYLNVDNTLQAKPAALSFGVTTMSVAWGDMDNDSDLDLALGNDDLDHPRGLPSYVYLNMSNESNESLIHWVSGLSERTRSVAWGDIDNDGDLDLAVGNFSQPSRIYLNVDGILQTVPVWSSTLSDNTRSVAWGDIDGDGDLDLAIGNRYHSNRVYLNVNGILQTVPVWSSALSDNTHSVAWGDVDGDGDLDLAVGNEEQPSRIYLNTDGMLQPIPAWSSTLSDNTHSVAWGDVDGDGDLDLAVGNYGQPSRIYLNLKPLIPQVSSVTGNRDSVHIALSSDRIQTFSGQTATALAPANFFAVAAIRQSGTIPISYTLFADSNQPVRAIRVYYSPEGSFSGSRDRWRSAKPAPGTQTTDLATSPYPTRTVTNTHVFTWDVFGSGFFGQSDNVVVRIEALPNLKPVRNGVPGPFQRPYVSTQSFPFRVRGSQVRVVQAGNPVQPVSSALVYRLPASQTHEAQPYQNRGGQPFRTDSQGYLQGRGELYPGDKLVALQPISSTKSYTLYHTSATPTASGLDVYTVAQSGVQTLTVSAERPLLLFNLTVSLEWDARNDPGYLAQLENDLRRTSQILFDLSNGQAALGDIAIYHDKGNWGSADVIITASNNQRPSAIMGGVVLTGTADLDLNGAHIADAYVPGQVRMGATWNRFGEAGGTLGEDWPRTLAHELGHYLFFLSDNYIGVTPDKQTIKMVDCVGSAMTDPYEEGYSEFLSKAQWTGECLDTVAARYLGRSDWESIQKFYPMLKDAPTNSGPSQLPLAVTRIQTFAPPTPPQSLAAPFFRLVDGNNTTVIVPNGRGQAYLHKRQGNSDPTDDYLIQLGSPVGDLVQVRGAAPGDRLCVYDFSQPVVRLGCLDPVGTTAMPVVLQAVNQWQPQVQVTGITTNTVVVTVTNVAENNLAVQLLPALGTASTEMPMTRQGSSFVQTVTAADGAYFGHIRIWVPGSQPHKELIVEYNALEAWNGRIKFWATPTDAWGGRIRFWAAPAYAWGGRIRFWAAPVMSNDGQVSIFALDNPYANNARYTLQTVAFPPALPTWLTPVGQAYRLSSDGTIPTSAILFSYLERDVPAGYENTLQIYFRKEGQAAWQSIPTQRDPHRNVVSAQAKGAGIYLLAATVEIKPRLAVGWNDIGYTIQQTQTVAAGLASIQGHYSIVRAFVPQASPPWLTYDPNVNPAFAQTVNTLQQVEYGHGYWIHATQAVTLYLDVSPEQVGAAAQAVDLTAGPPAPAEYYGWVLPSTSLTPVEGMSIRAEIDGVLCGVTTIERLAGQLAYHLQVAANVANDTPGCGEPGKAVTLQVGTQQVAQAVLWDNTRTYQVDLPVTNVDGIHRLYLPLISHR